MEIKTCEEYVLAELEKAQAELAEVKEQFKNYTDLNNALVESLNKKIMEQDDALDVCRRRMNIAAGYDSESFRIIFDIPWSSDYNKRYGIEEQKDFETLVSALGLEYPKQEEQENGRYYQCFAQGQTQLSFAQVDFHRLCGYHRYPHHNAFKRQHRKGCNENCR